MTYILGVDPGFAHMGMTILKYDSNTSLIQVVDSFVIGTNPSKKAAKVANDDVARMRVLWAAVKQAFVDYPIECVGVETYTVFDNAKNKGKGVGWKAGWLYSITCAVAFEHNATVYPFSPADLKRRMASKVSASKDDIENAMCQHLPDLNQFLNQTSPSLREHAADSAGHALMALKDYAKLC